MKNNNNDNYYYSGVVNGITNVLSVSINNYDIKKKFLTKKIFNSPNNCKFERNWVLFNNNNTELLIVGVLTKGSYCQKVVGIVLPPKVKYLNS